MEVYKNNLKLAMKRLLSLGFFPQCRMLLLKENTKSHDYSYVHHAVIEWNKQKGRKVPVVF